MNLTERGDRTVVSLSRRNLVTLIKMLDVNVSGPYLVRRTDVGLLEVRAEEDNEHYGERQAGFGPDNVQELADTLKGLGIKDRSS